MENTSLNQYEYNDSQFGLLSSGTSYVGLDPKVCHYDIAGRGGRWTDECKQILLGCYVKSRNIRKAAEHFFRITGHTINHRQAYHLLSKFTVLTEPFINDKQPLNCVYNYTTRAKQIESGGADKVVKAITAEPRLLTKGHKFLEFFLGVNIHAVKRGVKRYKENAEPMRTAQLPKS